MADVHMISYNHSHTRRRRRTRMNNTVIFNSGILAYLYFAKITPDNCPWPHTRVFTNFDITDNMMFKTICPLGDAAAMPIESYVKKFRDEFEKHVTEGGCPIKKDKSIKVPENA